MKSAAATCLLAVSCFSSALAAPPAHSADEPSLERLATCQESWLDWQNDVARGQKFVTSLHANYSEQEVGGYLVPKGKATLFGLPIARVRSAKHLRANPTVTGCTRARQSWDRRRPSRSPATLKAAKPC
jgi:hypothetical protein